jgi:hypothetical protein
MTRQTRCRETRLDCLRGIALLVVLVDHIEYQANTALFRAIAPISTCYFNGAEAFVFLSGLVFGRVVSPRMKREGFILCETKSISRAVTIYVTYLVTAWIAILIGWLFSDPLLFTEARIAEQESIGSRILWSLMMCYQPCGLAILAMYAVLLPFMPLLLFLHDRDRLIAWAITLGVYVAAQIIPGLGFTTFPGGHEWLFNPFAWQFLFFIGMVQGAGRLIPPLPGWGRVAVLSIAVATFVIGISIRTQWISLVFGTGEVNRHLSVLMTEWSHQTRLQPLCIIHFLSFALTLAAVALPVATSSIWHSRYAAPLVACGQCSLAVYSFGEILVFLSAPLFHLIGKSAPAVMMVSLDCCLLSVLFASLFKCARFRSICQSVRDANEIEGTSPISPPT